MHQYDVTAGQREDLLEHLLGIFEHRIKATAVPCHHFKPEFTGNRMREQIPMPDRRSEFHRRHTGRLTDRFLTLADFPLRTPRPRTPERPLRMSHRVIADLMPSSHDLFRKLRMFPDLLADHEKHRLRFVAIQ